MPTLEDVLACVNNWICLGRIFYDIFGSPLSLGVDHLDYFWFGWFILYDNVLNSILVEP